MPVEETPQKVATPHPSDSEPAEQSGSGGATPHDGESPAVAVPAAPFLPLPLPLRWLPTLEQVLYLLLAVVALIAHLWVLGERALHHDETLHAFYSWRIYQGEGYIHDPLLHGPFLYFFGALMYFLFGDSDFTARLGVALFGTALVLMPYLVRRELGRPAALMASCYMLISPIFLYMSRMLRHDMYSMLFEMLIFVAVVRYASTRRAHWLYAGVAAFALMFANQETSYLFLLMMGTPLVLLLLWHVYKPGIAFLGALAVALAALVFVLPGEAEVDGSHTAVRHPETSQMEYTPGPFFGWYPLETDDNAYALRIRNRADNDGGASLLANLGEYLADLWDFFSHPAILLGIGLLLATVGALTWQLWFARDRAGQTPWQRACSDSSATGRMRVCRVFASLTHQGRWLIALLIFLVIYMLLFTAFFTNLLGTITGVTGSLLYWLAQHNVERGGQPPHYYLVLLFVYEPLLLFWGGIALLLIVLGLLRRGAGGTWHYLPLLLAWWSLAALGIYSWAGEKMPWLLVHVALPMVLLSAWAVQTVVRAVSQPFSRALEQHEAPPPPDGSGGAVVLPWQWHGATERFVLFGAIFLFAVMFFFIEMTVAVNGGRWHWPARLLFFDFPWAGQQIPIAAIPIITLLFLGWLTIAAGMSWGWRWSLAALAVCITLTGSLYTVRNAYRAAYELGDVPREMLIYTQTSPDVSRLVRRLEELSIRRTGSLAMPILYDNETVSRWYFRNFTEKQELSPPLTEPPGDEIQAMLLLTENVPGTSYESQALEGFCARRYPLRWWFPEREMYELHDDAGTEEVDWRSQPLDQVSLLARTLRAPFADETLEQLWMFLVHRDPGVSLGSTDFIFAVRQESAYQVSPGLCGAP